jgi:hypothetical protein
VTQADGQSILMDTATGSAILNFQAPAITQPVQAQALEAKIVAPRVLRGPSHPRYNCHGLTFGARRSAILEDSQVSRILAEDGYQPVIAAEALPGDCVIYFDTDGAIDHSGVVVSSPPHPMNVPLVCSKWGYGPEVIHAALDVGGYAIVDLRYYRVLP